MATSNQALSGSSRSSAARACSIGEPMALCVITSESDVSVDPALFGEQHAFAECEHLHREADVDRQLEQQGVAGVADEGHRAAELAQDRLHPLERVGLPAGDDRQACPPPRPARCPRRVRPASTAPRDATRSARARLARGPTVLMSM